MSEQKQQTEADDGQSRLTAGLGHLSFKEPIGFLHPFLGSVAPDGFLLCPPFAEDISRTEYADLFNAIGSSWSEGDGVTTFGRPYTDYVMIVRVANK